MNLTHSPFLSTEMLVLACLLSISSHWKIWKSAVCLKKGLAEVAAPWTAPCTHQWSASLAALVTRAVFINKHEDRNLLFDVQTQTEMVLIIWS